MLIQSDSSFPIEGKSVRFQHITYTCSNPSSSLFFVSFSNRSAVRAQGSAPLDCQSIKESCINTEGNWALKPVSLVCNCKIICIRSQVQSSRFRVIFLSVRRTQIRILLTLLICRHLFGVPACALTPICFFNHALNSPTNLFFPYILRSRMAGGFAVNSEPLNPWTVTYILTRAIKRKRWTSSSISPTLVRYGLSNVSHGAHYAPDRAIL